MDKKRQPVKKWPVVLAACILAALTGIAQQLELRLFTLDSFMQQVKKYHPIAKQANIQVDKADAGLLSAKGSFDPTIVFDASRKTFDGKSYYFYTNLEFTIPLPIGNLKAGLENNGGDLLNSEITKGKTSYLGLEIPLLKGLLLDKRRAVLQQAKLFRLQSDQQRLIILNDLFFQAYNTYWQWAASYQQYKTYTKFTEIADKRLRLIRIAFVNGDKAMMDTVEAFTQLQNYQLLQAEAILKWNNTVLELNNYLWSDHETGYQLQAHYLPDSAQFSTGMAYQNAEEWIEQSALQNPALRIYDYKMNSLEVERKLKFQNLLPYFSLKANLLNKDYYALKNLSSNFIQNNYQLGINFAIPLFLREARGDYKLTQLKIKETRLEWINKRQLTDNKIRSYFTDLNSLLTQLQITKSIYRNYESLLRSEELKFAQGESSLFLVNTREIKLIELIQKKIELSVKCFKAYSAIQWAAGVPY